MDGLFACSTHWRELAFIRCPHQLSIPLYVISPYHPQSSPLLSILIKKHFTSLSISDIEAEIRYAVRNEYAQTVIDVIARRTRLSFLNAQAALDAVPRVVEIMAEELDWDRERRRKEVEGAVVFLGSMGLAPGAANAVLQDLAPKSFWERIGGSIWGVGGTVNGVKSSSALYSRSRFEAGEVETLRHAFMKRARTVFVVGGEGAGRADSEMRLSKLELGDLLNELPGYEGISEKDYEYVLEEAGFKERVDVDFDEFLEVSSVFFVFFLWCGYK